MTYTDLIIPEELNPNSDILELIKDFINNFETYEIKNKGKLIIYFDKKSNTYYLTCHITSQEIINKTDLNATIEQDEQDGVIYKLNREITEDTAAYIIMEEDAKKGRSFEDMVVEYDKSYYPLKPLKVYGGQHRIRAITNAKDSQKGIYHGVRIYFNLNREQKIEIATINNTSITVPLDLLDRMREQFLGSELRNWCQSVGLLNKNQDFSDRRNPIIPTVRSARTLLLNFFLGKGKKENDFNQPIIAKSGSDDERYLELRKEIDWKDDSLLDMGKHFAKLHSIQYNSIINRKKDNYLEFARKALSLSVISSWAFTAGLFLDNKKLLYTLYNLPNNVMPPDDPLSAKSLSQARLQGTDSETYRGLGTRSSNDELGRMLEVFILLCQKSQKKITLVLANAAIRSFEAKKLRMLADKAVGKI